MPQSEMTQTDLIKNFAFCSQKPFTTNDVVEFCGVKERYARLLLKRLVDKGDLSISKIGAHGANVYVWGVKGEVKKSPSYEIIYNILFSNHKWLRKEELIEKTGLAEATIERWLPALLTENAVIAKYVDGNLAYYTAVPEADLTTIKPLREYGIRND